MLFRVFLYAFFAWLFFRWMDFLFGNRSNKNDSYKHPQPPRPNHKKKPNSDKVGDYVDFEEVDD